MTVSLDRARRMASVAHVVAIVACVLIVLMIVPSAIPAGAALVSGEAAFADRLISALVALIPALPLAIFFLSVFRLRQALDHYSDGEFFSAKPARHIAGAGITAALALVAAAVVAPALQAWSEGTPYSFAIDPVLAPMLAFALFVMIVGRILEAAAAIKAENDQII